MYNKVKQYIETNDMIQRDDMIIAGVSGGSDSVAMLYLLNEYRKDREFQIKVVHVHHGIRGKEADRDSRFVENLCEKLNIPCSVYRYNVPMLSQEWKLGLEETGRIVRKEAFQNEITNHKEFQCKIAIAHNQDDLAETLIHNLVRGSGLRGLCSMKPKTESIIRPVLCLKKKEIEEHLEAIKANYILDSSNYSEEYTRNKIRHNILPYMEQEINKQASAHIAEMARVAAMAEEYFVEKSRELLQQYLYKNGFLFEESLFKEKEIIQAYVIQEAIENLAGKRKDISSVHIRKIIELQKHQTGREIHLPYSLIAKKIYEGVYLYKNVERFIANNSPNVEIYSLPETGEISGTLGTLQIKVFSNKHEKIEEKTYTKWFDYDKIKSSLCLRTRRTGDYMIINHTGNRKKLTRILIDEKIPAEKRNDVPVVATEQEVLWIIGSRMSEKYKITSNTKKILELHYQGGKENE